MLKKMIKDNYIFMYTIYFIAIFIRSTTFPIDYPWIAVFIKAIRYIICVYFLFRILIMIPEYKKDLNLKNWKSKSIFNKFLIIIGCIFFISSIINFITTLNNRIILLMLIILASYKVDYKKIIKQTLILQVVLTIILIIMSILGITQDFTIIRSDTGAARHSLGFEYPTNLAQMILFSSLLYIYINHFKVSFIKILIIQILNILGLLITNTKADFIVLESIIIFIVLYKLLYKKEFFNKILKKVTKIFAYTFPIYPIINFIMVLLYPTGGIFTKIDSVLSKRLQLPYNILKEYGINLFGHKIEFIGKGIISRLKYGDEISKVSNYVDSEYLQMLFREGAIITICFVIIMTILVIMLYKKKKHPELFICIVYLLFGLINPRIISLLYSPIPFLIIPTFVEFLKDSESKKIIVE